MTPGSLEVQRSEVTYRYRVLHGPGTSALEHPLYAHPGRAGRAQRQPPARLTGGGERAISHGSRFEQEALEVRSDVVGRDGPRERATGGSFLGSYSPANRKAGPRLMLTILLIVILVLLLVGGGFGYSRRGRGV